MELNDLCLGRITLRLPAERALVNASSRVDDVLIEALSEGGGAPSLDSLRQSETTYLTGQARGETSPVTAEQTTDDYWVARYKTRARRSEANAAHGVVISGDTAFRLNSVGDETVIDEVAAAVERVARNITPPDAAPRPPHNGFCLPSQHVVTQSYEGYNEEVRVQYRLPNGDMLTLRTQTNNDKLPDSLPESLAKGGADFEAAFGTDLDFVVVEGLGGDVFKGDAAQLLVGKPDSVLIWRSVGKPRDPENPYIEITLEQSDAETPRFAFMAEIVSSLRRVGGGS